MGFMNEPMKKEKRVFLSDLRVLANQMAKELGLKRVPHIYEKEFHYYNGDRHEVGIDLLCKRIPLPFTLAHEMRHAFQYENGWLKEGRSCYWMGIVGANWHGQYLEYQPNSQEEYEQIPWEADANEWAHAWYARYLGGQAA